MSIRKPFLCRGLLVILVMASACGGSSEQAVNAERARTAQLSAALDAVAVQTTQYQVALARVRAELADLSAHCATLIAKPPVPP